MPIEIVNDLNDPRVAVYRSLKATNRTRGLDQFVVEGAKLVDRLLASRFPVVSILATDRFDLDHLAPAPPETSVYIVPHDLVHEIVGFPFHRGVLASGRRVPWPGCRALMDQAGDRATLAICPKLSNPENLGAIARIGDVFGIDGILAGPSCPDPLSRRVLRVSMGSVLRLPVIVERDLGRAVDDLVSSFGLELRAAVAEPGALPFEALPRPDRIGLVLGDEDGGVDDAWLRRCRHIVTIPMRRGVGSLNVSVAAGILLYHLSRN